MKVFLFFIFILSASSSSAQKKGSIYLAHCDSIFYLEGEIFDSTKIKRGKLNDSAFINRLFKNIAPNQELLFKPYTDICNDDGIMPLIISWKNLLTHKGFRGEVSFTDSIEDKYFGDISLKQSVLDTYQSRNTSFPNLPAPPLPPPVKIIVTKDGKPTPGANEDVIFLKEKGVVTFLLSGGDNIYYYEGVFRGTLKKTDFTTIRKLILQFKRNIIPKDLMFLIKTYGEAKFKNIIDLLDEITICKISAGHYAEVDISGEEEVYLKSISAK